MNTTLVLAVALSAVLLTACGTTDSKMQQQGHSMTYIQGFHDGRHSGMKEEGNYFEHFMRDEVRYTSEPDYHTGWDAGEVEGKRLQDQAAAAGTAAAAGMAAGSISKEASKQNDPDRIARDALKNTDTSGLENLGK